jgi:hypothetical protein
MFELLLSRLLSVHDESWVVDALRSWCYDPLDGSMNQLDNRTRCGYVIEPRR